MRLRKRLKTHSLGKISVIYLGRRENYVRNKILYHTLRDGN